MQDERQRFGFKLIITYKFCKAALMLGVALWLTSPRRRADPSFPLAAIDDYG